MIVNCILRSNFTIAVKTLPNFSYGRFVLENPRANKEERIKALKEFLNKTR